MIVVLDTNVVVSGIFFHGLPASILEAWFEGRFEVYATPKILEEYLRVLEEVSTLKSPRFEHDPYQHGHRHCAKMSSTSSGAQIARAREIASVLLRLRLDLLRNDGRGQPGGPQ